ncbi:MsnO8 family LLM class oxidoreductase [Paenibacillus sediminis]|uniref:Luciferase family oxidoreductase group 1 n=1 Tax=Paenibacillus sediminis TaxID=664909 RepID=A0ABS4H4A2_9BACL|nr:MsnO8 family LLM class oxidoreductase [Paenibacillus sediminis]MBP1937359.1 luciferase family oxidoreductase group 1 [Paenibacillus sediminis]
MTNIKLSVLDLVPVLEDTDDVGALHQAVLLAQSAEKWGYRRYWTSEHHDMEALASATPEVLLAHIGARTSTIHLGSGAVLLPHYSPLKVAEAFHLLAALYPGRVDLGIGRAPGGSAHASMALSGNYLEHVRNLPKSIQALRDLLTGKYRYEDVPVQARPIPPEAPSLWLLGTNVKSAGYAAEYGTGYVFGKFMSEHDGKSVLAAYREQFQPSQLMSEPKAIVAISIICAETTEEANRIAGGEKADIIGDPSLVQLELEKLSQTYETDEFIVINSKGSYKERLKSYQLIAEVMSLQ